MATIRNFERIISADSHVYKPSDRWWKALGDKFGESPERPEKPEKDAKLKRSQVFQLGLTNGNRWAQ